MLPGSSHTLVQTYYQGLVIDQNRHVTREQSYTSRTHITREQPYTSTTNVTMGKSDIRTRHLKQDQSYTCARHVTREQPYTRTDMLPGSSYISVQDIIPEGAHASVQDMLRGRSDYKNCYQGKFIHSCYTRNQVIVIHQYKTC